MKKIVRVLWALGFVMILSLAGCTRSTETGTGQKSSPEAAVTPEPAPTAAVESSPAQAAPALPAKPPDPKPAKKEQAAKKPAPAASPAERKPVRPTVAAEAQPAAQPQVKTAQSAPVAPVPAVQRVTLAAGTLIPIRTIDSIDSKTSEVGQTFSASIDSDVVLDDEVVVAKGTDARLKLTRLSTAGKIRGKSELTLQLDRIVIGKKSYAVVSDVIEREGSSQGKKTARDVAIGGAIGAAVGAIAGGGKGAAIGAGVGAGSGVAIAVITKGEQVQVPSESRLEFRLEQPLQINVQKR